jgi:hypothetical protein
VLSVCARLHAPRPLTNSAMLILVSHNFSTTNQSEDELDR